MAGTLDHASSQKRATIFIGVIGAAIAIGYGGIVVFKLNPIGLAALLILLAVVLWLSPSLVVFKEYERGVLFRLGKFHEISGPGLQLVFPAIDSYTRVDLRDFRIDTPAQPVITKDNISITIDAVCIVRIVDPKKAIVEVADYQKSLAALIYANIREAVSNLDLETVLDKSDELNELLIADIAPVAQRWGLQVIRMEIERITLPEALQQSMNQRREAEERKVRAQTDAQARQLVLDALNESAGKLSPVTMEYLYLDTLKRVADGRATKIIFPAELSRVAQVISKRLDSRSLPSALSSLMD